MQDLISQLESLEGEGGRSKISIIRELNGSIRKAQDKGYKVAAIHQEIAKTVAIDLTSFRTLLYRVRKKPTTEISAPTHVSIKQNPVKKDVTESETIDHSKPKDLKAVTERSKNKLASFGKGKQR